MGLLGWVFFAAVLLDSSILITEEASSNGFSWSDIPGGKDMVDLKGQDLQKLKWWKDVKPSRLKSRLPHHKRPPNLLSSGVFKFRSGESTNYYFHNQANLLCALKVTFIPHHVLHICPGSPHLQVVALYEALPPRPQDQLRLRRQGSPEATDHVAQRRAGAILVRRLRRGRSKYTSVMTKSYLLHNEIIIPDQRVARGQVRSEEQDGDRPGDAKGRRVLRMSGRQQVRHRQEGIHRKVPAKLKRKYLTGPAIFATCAQPRPQTRDPLGPYRMMMIGK